MASKVKFQVSFTPIEDNTTQAGGSNMIAASECYGTLSGGGELDVTIDGTGGNNHGYDDGVVNYVQAATSSTTAISMTPPDIVAIKIKEDHGIDLHSQTFMRDKDKLKKLKEVPDKAPKNVTNALFVGSTTELQKLLKKNK